MKTSRQKLIDATFEELYKYGYSGTSLGNILINSGVKKGSLYHHFSSKKELVLAMIKEKFLERVEKNWEGLKRHDADTIDTLISILKNGDRDFQNGCPMGNILQECSGLDEDFINLIDEILSLWEKIFEDTIAKAIKKGEIKTVNSKEMALFLIAVYEGAILMSKRSKSQKEYKICIEQLEFLLNSLRVEEQRKTKV